MPLFGPPNIEKSKQKRNVRALVKALSYDQYKHRKLRVAAAEALGELADPRAIDGLLVFYKKYSYKGSEHTAAARALANIGSVLSQKGDPQALKPLQAVFNDSDWTVRKTAAESFERLGAAAVPALLSFHKDRSLDMRKSAQNTILKIGEASIPALVTALQSARQSERSFALGTLDALKYVPARDETAAWYWIAKKEWTQAAALGQPALKPLSEVLKDGEALAAAALAEAGGVHALPVLIETLENGKDGTVQQACARALGRIGDPAAVVPLVSALTDPQRSVQNAAAEALCQIKDGQGIAPLIQLLNPANKHFFKAVREELVRLGEPAVPWLVKSLETSKPERHESLIEMLGEIGSPAAIPALLPFLSSREEGMISKTASTLGAIGDKTVSAEIKALLGHTSPAVRAAAADALDRLTWKPEKDRLSAVYLVVRKNWNECASIGSAALEPLLAALQTEKSNHHLPKIIAAVGEIGDPQAIEPVSTFLKHDYHVVRKAAVEALAASADPAVVPLLAKARNDKENVVALAAYDALGKIGTPQCIDILIESLPKPRAGSALTRIGEAAVLPLMEVLQSQDAQVRRAAAETLGQIGDRRAVEALLECLEDGSSEVQKGAVFALGMINDRSTVEALVLKLEKPGDPAVRQAVLDTLVKIGDQRAVVPLIRIAGDPQEAEALRSRAIEKLSGFKDPQIASVLIEILEDESPAVQTAAMRACGDLGDSRTVDALVNKLPDVAAIRALGKITDPRALEPLINLLDLKDFHSYLDVLNALAALHKSGRLTEGQKQQILSQGDALQRRRSYISGHTDIQTCFDHTDDDHHSDRHADFANMV